MARSRPRYQRIVFLVLLLSAFFFGAQKFTGHVPRSSEPGVSAGTYADIQVVHVYDGDTIKLADGQRVRLVGIDTPESRENRKLFRDARRSRQDAGDILRMGRMAAAYTRSLLSGRRVRLEFDIERQDDLAVFWPMFTVWTTVFLSTKTSSRTVMPIL